MALLRSRILSKALKDRFAVLSRSYAEEKTFPLPMELATGLEKWQMEQNLKGDDDPFKMKAIKRHASSKSNPIVVQSYFDCRIVGCICEEDSGSVIWMWLFKGEPRRCRCGHWFKLTNFRTD